VGFPFAVPPHVADMLLAVQATAASIPDHIQLARPMEVGGCRPAAVADTRLAVAGGSPAPSRFKNVEASEIEGNDGIEKKRVR
jgi:hypothetical protein